MGASSWFDPGRLGGLASIAAGAVHAAAAGIHAEHPTLSRLFVLVAAAQLVAGVVLLVRPARVPAAATVLLNLGAVIAWGVTRIWGISWISGLEQAEAPQFADTICAIFGALAVAGAALALRGRPARPAQGFALVLPSAVIGALAVAAMLSAATHVHAHDDSAAAGGHEDGTETAAGAAVADDDHSHASTEPPAAADDPVATTIHGHGADTAEDHAHPETTVAEEPQAALWPRAWDPTAPIDFSGVEGVTAEQEARAEALVAASLQQLPQFADVTTLPALGFRSIGDASTGHEHYINIDYITDDAFLDPSRPESLVYAVDGDQRTLVSAMYIARDTPIDDPELVDYGGPLMEWHVHENLCWSLDEAGQPVVVGVLDEAGNCPPASVNAGGNNPMVHVWIAPHECGPFAALEGHGAGQAADEGSRADQCAHEHEGDEHADHEAAAVAPVPYDPTKPIDLSGVEGVSPEQQAYAENLVAVTVTRLPQWSDPAVAEAAGFHSIGDAATGHEHYINWNWIDDDVWLDPDAPESLVYEPQPDGTKKLVSAMYMLPHSIGLADVPNNGGRLMQWHVHDNLCFTDDAVAPQVAGLRAPNGECRAPLVARAQSPMIHVWITPHECGPFAALEGLGAGSIQEGEERWCDHAHGS